MEFPYRAFLCACGGRYAPPPHAWGILPYLASRYVRGRFIPTCVGNTVRFMPQAPGKSVHPHVRGEYFGLEDKFIAFFGSSPRAWGILQQVLRWPKVLRFIPTCVGNTFPTSAADWPCTVHPHVRGEYASPDPRPCVQNGSSPRAWGILWESAAPWYAIRFIPTCVGNTPSWRSPSVAATVHPHVRGEYLRSSPSRGRRVGSSPRAWGIQDQQGRQP